MEKTTKKYMIDAACPVDNNLILKTNKKLDNFSELWLELARMWDKETYILPIIIGASGFVPEELDISLKKLDILYTFSNLRKNLILGNVNFLRKVLAIKWKKWKKTKKIKRQRKGLSGGGGNYYCFI